MLVGFGGLVHSFGVKLPEHDGTESEFLRHNGSNLDLEYLCSSLNPLFPDGALM